MHEKGAKKVILDPNFWNFLGNFKNVLMWKKIVPNIIKKFDQKLTSVYLVKKSIATSYQKNGQFLRIFEKFLRTYKCLSLEFGKVKEQFLAHRGDTLAPFNAWNSSNHLWIFLTPASSSPFSCTCDTTAE